MSSASSSLAALCAALEAALSTKDTAQISGVCKELQRPTEALIGEQHASLSSSPSVEADEAARPLLLTLQLLVQCAQLTGFPYAAAHELFKAVRGICTTGSMQHYLTAAAASVDSHGGQLLYAIVHHLMTCSTQWLDEVSKSVYESLTSSRVAAAAAANQSPILKPLKLCRVYLHPLMHLIRAFPTLFHAQLPRFVMMGNRVMGEILAVSPANPHHRLALQECFTVVHGLLINSTLVLLASPALHITEKCDILNSLFPFLLIARDDISSECAASVLYLLCQLMQSASQLPADVVRAMFSSQLPVLVALLPRAHPHACYDFPAPAPVTMSQKKDSAADEQSSNEPTFPQQPGGKLLANCSLAVCSLLNTILATSNSSSLPSTNSSLPLSQASTPPSSPPDTSSQLAVRSFLWRHLLSPQLLVSRLILTVFVHAIPRWGTTFRVQTLRAALHVLRVGDRPLEELWRLVAVEATSDLLSAIFPLLSESEQHMLWTGLAVVDGLTRLAADCDVVVGFDVPHSSSRSISSSSQSLSQSLTPTQRLSASPPASQSQIPDGGSGIPLCLAVRLLYRTHLSALHSATQAVVSQTLIRLLVAYVAYFSGAERISSVEQLSLLLYTFNLLEWLLASPLAFSIMLSPAQQSDLLVKVAAALSTFLRVEAAAAPSFLGKDASSNGAMTATVFMDRVQNCPPLLQQRLLLAVLGLLDTPCVDEFTTAQLQRVLYGVAAIADRWPSIRWRLPPLLLRVCGSPAIRSAAAVPDSAASRLMATVTGMWQTLLERPPSQCTSLTDMLCFASAITRLFDSTSRLASTPFRKEAAALLPSNGKDEVLRWLREWQSITQSSQPSPPSDDQWSILQSQRQIMDGVAAQAQQQRQQPLNGLEEDGSVRESGVKVEAAGGQTSGLVLGKLQQLMRHNVRAREVAVELVQARSLISDEAWRQVKAALSGDEADWIATYNAINALL